MKNLSRFTTLCLLLLGGPLCAGDLSRFVCERPRPWQDGSLHNVSVAAALVDSVVLKPGQVFSFNQAMFAGDGRFVEGVSFMGGRRVHSVGGGICQVSSGLYNAALLAGLEVLERNAHSLYDPGEAYVPPGRDAMVSRPGHSDFRFRNSTAADLTIQVRAEGGRLTVVLQGRQRRARRRWLDTSVLSREPARVVEVPSSGMEAGHCRRVRPGFDGLVVATRLCWTGAGGLTRCAELGVDHYRRVDELWKVGGMSVETR